ncbi:hypothetical protein [Emticicia sp. BO119]|uniref:hypothetical protein n=1 Tax=Emticicia sp. BO119 TaxID=2757768 RepID=UPI0015F07578|nr:hypothetical protein [Emticicia sp. BO119]MBA4851847.1 hypothetical protein [Emticicia sp. BO119]
MMTKITSQSTAFIRKAICFPLFAALAFCLIDFQLMAQEPTKLKLSSPPTVTSGLKSHKLAKEDVNYQNATVMVTGKNRLPTPKKYSELAEEEKSKPMKVMYFEKSAPTQEIIDKWKESSEQKIITI